MKFGAVFPTCEIGNDPVAIRDFAQAAEELGYAHILVYDHVLGAVHEDREPRLTGPYTQDDAFHEPFVLYGYLAAVTTRIELATGVVILPQRQTALVAKQAAELSVLSQGRFRLGVGTGWNHVEYESLGERFEERGPRFDEQVEVLRRLWSERVVDFSGTFHRIDRAGLLPLPESPVPLWFGGMAKPAVRRAARLGDGFTMAATHPFMLDLTRYLHERLDAEGRDAGAFGLETIVGYGVGPDRWQKDLAAWQAAGASHFSMRAMSTGAKLIGDPDPGFTTPQQHIDALETFMRAVS